MKTHKPCKGMNKAKGFKGCGKEVYANTRRYGLCTSCYADFILNTDAGRILLEKATLKATKPRRDYEAFEKQQKETKSLSILLKSTKDTCHTYIRERDKGKPCISCGEPYRLDFQAGHCFKSELFSSLRFNENNIHGQCQGCNIFKEGNEAAYISRLPERIGRDNFEELLRLSRLDKTIQHKWEREQLISIRRFYMEGLKKLKKQ